MEEKLHVKKRNASGIVPWEPYKAAISAYERGSRPGVLPPLIKYQFVKPDSVGSKNKAELETTEGQFSESVDSGKVEIYELSRIRPIGDGKESSPLSGNVEIEKEENTDNSKELRRLKKDLELERQLTQELKRILVATMGDDLTCHVKSLSEDKVRLAHKMTKFEAQISHDHDRAEDLAILADMWRCKFLAMSIRADEMRNQRSQALIKEARAILEIDLSTFFERSPCDEKIYKPVSHTSNITITCCKHCVGKEIKLI
ncbi:hypothetical protein ACH3XW_6430 [Acanthocheilonema viteae]